MRLIGVTRCGATKTAASPSGETIATAPVKTGSPCLIALDWGSSSLRAFLLDDSGETLAERTSADGAYRLAGGPAAYEQALRQLAGDWLAAYPPLLWWLAAWLVASMAGARRNTFLARCHFRTCTATRRRCRVVWACSFASSRAFAGRPVTSKQMSCAGKKSRSQACYRTIRR